ncbi:hypothetical protein MSPP1_000433 [Malassezia sp. CBS 17886]|nr:hypothetical protein MSPP1_000433 [Malassezia sp. CBS 17886]
MPLPEAVKDVMAGTVGGVAQVLVGQPFDIIKVRIQTEPPGTYSGVLGCIKEIARKEGPLAFYKGTELPLLGVGACVSIQFGVMQYLKRKFTAYNGRETGVKAPGMTHTQLYVAGSASGIVNSFLACPIEQVRIRLQTQHTRLFSGPFDCLSKIHQVGGLRGVYHGMGPTMLREGHGMGVYFLTYEYVIDQVMRRKNIARKDLAPTVPLLAGASSGLALWLMWFFLRSAAPQTDSIYPAQRKYKNAWDVVRQLYRTDGVHGFLRGITPTLIRAPFANGATFLAFEWALHRLDHF